MVMVGIILVGRSSRACKHHDTSTQFVNGHARKGVPVWPAREARAQPALGAVDVGGHRRAEEETSRHLAHAESDRDPVERSPVEPQR